MKIKFLLLFVFASSIVYGQNGQIKGTVRAADGEPGAYVNISLKNTSRGTVSDQNGKFEIRNVVPGDYILIASFVGLETSQVSITVRENELTQVPDLILKESSHQLQQIIISGSRDKYKTDKTSPSLRITTPIMEVPQNIQVITKEVLADQQAFDMLESVQRNVSGAQRVEHWDNYARINMRGSQITSFRNGLNVQISPWSPLAEDMSMVERIEFVKGPAGFMLSAGEPGGFYNVVTKRPTGIRRGEVSFSLGSFDTYRATVDLDGSLSSDDKLLYRVNVMGQLKGSHRDFEYNNRYSIAPVIKYQIDEQSALTLEYTHQFSQMNVIGSNYSFSRNGYGDLPLNFTTAEPNLDPTEINDRSIMAIFEHQFSDDWKFTAQAAYFNHRQIGQSIWPTGFVGTSDSLLQRGISIWDAFGTNKAAQMFVNGKIATGKVVHQILGGVDMSLRDYYADWNQGALLGDTTFNIYKPQYGRLLASEIPQWDRSQDIRERGVRYNNGYNAVYLQDEISLFANKLRLTLAARYTSNKYINPYSGTSTDSKLTPRLGASYSITRNSSAYFVYDQAFLANPGSDWQGRNFDPVTGNNIEIGLKKDWMNHKWNSVISAYRITKNNILTVDPDHPIYTRDENGNLVETGQFYNKQTGQQQIQGIEVDVKGELVRNLGVIFNYAYTDAEVTKDSDPEVVGNKVAGATKHIQNLWLNYSLANGYLQGLRFSVGYQYQAGRSSWYVFDGSENSLPDYFRLDAAVGYASRNFSVNLNINNVLNKYLYSGAPYGDMFYWQTEPGRNARLTVGYKF